MSAHVSKLVLTYFIVKLQSPCVLKPQNPPEHFCSGGFWFEICDEGSASVIGRPGGDLLFRVLRRSTIGAGAFNGRVRDGIGFRHSAIATRPANDRRMKHRVFSLGPIAASCSQKVANFLDKNMRQQQWASTNENDQANRTISTDKLQTLLSFHTRPINVVVYHGSQGRNCFEVGFPLRCIQRLSRPHIATLHCDWRHNRSTGGAFIPVLSY
jgi:hypothetical protein